MRIIHTADWHLGNVFHGHDRLAEHRHFLDWLLARLGEQQPDALLVTGDVFDSPYPSAASEALFYDFMVRATQLVPGLQVVVIAGNSDSANRIEISAALLKLHNVYVRGAMRYTEAGDPDFTHFLLPLSPRNSHEAACVCFALPYLRPCNYQAGLTTEQGLAYYFSQLHKKFRKSDFSGLPVVVAAHFGVAGAVFDEAYSSGHRIAGAGEPVGIDVIGSGVSYAALGHLHRAQQIASDSTLVFYAGGVLPMSFAEEGYTYGVQLVEVDAEGSATADRLVYTPLRQLITIPAAPRTAVSADELLDALARLPKRSKHDTGNEAWPYLEIHVEAKDAGQDLLHKVLELTADRAVHLCRMVSVHSARQAAASASDSSSEVCENLRSVNPLQLARQYFAAHYSEEMPQQFTDRLKQAVEAANNE